MVVLSVYSLWLHSLCLFNEKTFAGSTYQFSFSVDKLIKMLWHWIVSFVLYRSAVFSKSFKARLVGSVYLAGVLGVLLHLRHWNM